MSPKADKRVLKPGTSSVFVGCGGGHSSVAWRLDVRDDLRGGAGLFGKGGRPCFERGRTRLFHYISAGGMRQLRHTSADESIEESRHSFLVFLGLMFAVWMLFYFLPCA